MVGGSGRHCWRWAISLAPRLQGWGRGAAAVVGRWVAGAKGTEAGDYGGPWRGHGGSVPSAWHVSWSNQHGAPDALWSLSRAPTREGDLAPPTPSQQGRGDSLDSDAKQNSKPDGAQFRYSEETRRSRIWPRRQGPKASTEVETGRKRTCFALTSPRVEPPHRDTGGSFRRHARDTRRRSDRRRR